MLEVLLSPLELAMPTYDKLPHPSEFFKGKWYNKLVDDLRLAGLSKRTVYGYVRAIRQLSDFHQKSPEKITEADVRQFLLYQIVEREAASGTQSVLLSGIKFFYRTTCPRKWKVLDQTKLNYTNALPEVITQAQVFQMIDTAEADSRRNVHGSRGAEKFAARTSRNWI